MTVWRNRLNQEHTSTRILNWYALFAAYSGVERVGVFQVSEGLVNVSDPPLHSRGNFLDSVVELDRRLLDYIVGLDTEINELVDGSVNIY